MLKMSNLVLRHMDVILKMIHVHTQQVEQGRKVVLTQPHRRTPPLSLLARPPSESLAELLSNGSSRWLDEGGSTKVCVMEPGDVLWLPAMQWHATLNLADTLAVGGQADPSSLTEQDWEAVSTPAIPTAINP